MYNECDKNIIISFYFYFFLFTYAFIYFWGVGCRDIRHLSEWESSPPPTPPPLKNNFTKMGELPQFAENMFTLVDCM